MQPSRTFTYEDIELAYTVSGRGPALILLHGWPFHKASFRKVLPLLEGHYTCYTLDAAGMGESGWTDKTDFSFEAHAKRVMAFADYMNIECYSVAGHDTGGTIARMLAVSDGTRVEKVIAIDTEVPGHLPVVVPKLQASFRKRLGRAQFKFSLSSRMIMRHWLGRSGFFVDKRLLDSEYMDLFVTSWTRTNHTFHGLLNYLLGVDHSLVERLDELHAQIKVPLLFIWGEQDGVFPVRRARDMMSQLGGNASLAVIAGAAFLPQEEKPEETARLMLDFLGASTPIRLAREGR